MDVPRRRLIRLAGVSIASASVAGCLSSDPGDGGTGDDDDRDDDGDGNDTGDGDGNDKGDGDGDDTGDGDGDVDDFSIDGRLHNEDSSARTFAVTIYDAADEEVASDEWAVEAGGTVSIPAVGRPGEPRTFEVTVGDVTATETLAFDVEAEPGTKAGYVDVTYTADGTLEIAFTPLEDDGTFPRVDEPPSEITEPECGDEGDRDPLWLCANVDAEPSLGFDQVETSASVLADEGLTLDAEAVESQYYATILREEDDLERVHDGVGGDVGALLEGTDFASEAVLVVQTGWGSGSETPHLKRIEETDDGVHAFGCYRRPCIMTDDFTMRTVVARLERPKRLEGGLVSLTVDPDRRVTFEVDGGVVTVAEE